MGIAGREIAGKDAPQEDLPELDEADAGEEALPPDPVDVATEDLPASASALAVGRKTIAHFARTLPNSPGVYRMFDRAGDVLYVGKAKYLKKRVQQYALGRAHTNRVGRMIGETAHMEFVVTATETEALLLESNLIKQLRPRYNVLLRDDKSFPYIFLSGDHPAPMLSKHRGARQRKGDYFGPFASAWAVKRTIDALQKAFLIRTCSDSFYENRTRPCLLYQIKRCSGPCTNEVSPDDYMALTDQARAFLSGRSSAVKQTLAADMQEASDALEFEKAARIRDRLAALSAVTATQDINTQGVEEADVFAIDEQAGQFCVEIFFFRNHQNWGNRALFPRGDRHMPLGEVLGQVMAQFYDDKPAPRLILASHDFEDRELLAEALSARMSRKVELLVPRRGEKRDLVTHAATNAREALGRRLAETAGQEKLLAALGQAFGLAKPPRRVEVYDNSHIMGTNAVGAMIVAGPGGFMKTHYRTFNIRSTEITPGDDFGMMREVLARRFAKLAKTGVEAEGDVAGVSAGMGADASASSLLPSREKVPAQRADEGAVTNPSSGAAEAAPPSPARGEGKAALLPNPDSLDPDAFPQAPDLVVIDGGKGQFEAARGILAGLGLSDIPLVSIAKGEDRNAGRETFFMAGREPFRMQPRDPALFFIQRLRDEAHRFAIGTHRAKRKRDTLKNPLDEIGGIGPTRKRALLLHFGTLKAIQRASLEDLMRAPGVNAATAKAVHAFFRQG
jgi:excinuclease ABC subunit C